MTFALPSLIWGQKLERRGTPSKTVCVPVCFSAVRILVDSRIMKTYTVTTDSFQADIEADTLNGAIAKAFVGEGMEGITNLASLERVFERHVLTGGFCRIDIDGDILVEIGSDK